MNSPNSLECTETSFEILFSFTTIKGGHDTRFCGRCNPLIACRRSCGGSSCPRSTRGRPPSRARRRSAGWRAEVVAGVVPGGLAGEADAGEALGSGEDDAAVGVVPGVGLVLAQDGELDAVDGQELVEGQAEGDGGEDVDLDEGLPAGAVGAEGVLPAPFRGEGGEVVRQAGIVAGPGVGAECGEGRVPTGGADGVSARGSAVGMIRGGRGGSRGRRFTGADLPPQVGVVAGQAAEAQRPDAEGVSDARVAGVGQDR